MKSLIELQIAVLADDNTGIQSYLSEIDRKTETELFQRAGEHFGFKTVLIEGRCYGRRSSLARVFGYTDESGVRKIFTRLQIPTRSIGSFGQNVRSELIEALDLSPKDTKATLICWDSFLVAGMHSTTDQAKQVQKYLLETERAARIANGVGLDLDLHKVRQNRLAEADQVSKMLARVDRIQDASMKRVALAEINDAMGGTLKKHGMQIDLLEEGKSQH
ncbi:hypothetical protein [Endozoicomonas ascidiicola]|uniref:hypothetical protein n=1 Tax=Endozoicomonas ascidiicola TaxID=1698521 RepID=UPI00082A11BD|nr:hypothetical protein [Endozoicomonas ascidiicola]